MEEGREGGERASQQADSPLVYKSPFTKIESKAQGLECNGHTRI